MLFKDKHTNQNIQGYSNLVLIRNLFTFCPTAHFAYLPPFGWYGSTSLPVRRFAPVSTVVLTYWRASLALRPLWLLNNIKSFILLYCNASAYLGVYPQGDGMGCCSYNAAHCGNINPLKSPDN